MFSPPVRTKFEKKITYKYAVEAINPVNAAVVHKSQNKYSYLRFNDL